MLNKEIMKKARSAESSEEIIKLAEEVGIKLTKEKAEEYFNSLHSSGEVSDEEIENATGGCGSYDASIYKKCPQCAGKIPMNDYTDVEVIGPGKFFDGSLHRFKRAYPSGVCEKCRMRFAYIYATDRSYLLTQKDGKWVTRPEFEIPNA